MQVVEKQVEADHEQVLSCLDEASGYHGLIAIHNTALGPAVGGTRFWSYASEEDAITDVLRLARGMSYKNAFAGIPLGGGKSIIIGDNRRTDREVVFRAHGRFVETLGGRYITAEDVGTSMSDMEYVRMETRHVAGLAGRSGDPSPVTAHGVFKAIQASAKFRWGADTLAGRTVAVQGCGNVGYYLAKELRRAGARLVATDTSQDRLKRVHEEFDAVVVPPVEIYGVEADIFAPCALGGIINDQTIPQLKVEIVAGAANNQLLETRHGLALEDRGILYAPDYVANAGGIINGCIELLGWDRSYTLNRVREIYDKLLMVFETAKTEKITTREAADRLAERRLQAARPAVQ